MITDLDKILKEWAYRVDDGKPNPSKSTHLYHLSEILNEYKWPFEVIDEFIQNLNEGDEWWTKLSPEQQAQYIKDHPKSQKAQDAKEKEKGEEPKDKKSKTKIKREDIDSIDGETKTKALNKEEKAPGNESSVINEIGVGIGMSHISDNPDISVQELEDKLVDEMMNTKIGKSNGAEATRNACKAAAKSAIRENKRTQSTIEKIGMNSETTKVSHVFGAKQSLENTVKSLEEAGVKEVNGIPFEEYKEIILAGGAGKNPTDTMVVMVDDSVKPPKAVINHTSNKTSSDDIQGN